VAGMITAEYLEELEYEKLMEKEKEKDEKSD